MTDTIQLASIEKGSIKDPQEVDENKDKEMPIRMSQVQKEP
jgi:hypothetical protein